MNIREACNHVMGVDLAASIIADQGLHWCALAAMAECKVSHGPECKAAIIDYFAEIKRELPNADPRAGRGGKMKALTLWQPWASLIMIGAKPYEFRRWDYRTRDYSLVGQRIVIHAGARPIRPQEVLDIRSRLESGDTSLIRDKALPIIERLLAAHKCAGVLPLSAGLGTAIIGVPRNVDGLFKSPDSDRIDHHMWAWPLTDIRPWLPPIEMRGAQGFWNWPIADAA